MTKNFSVPGVIFSIDFVEYKPVINNKWTEALFSLAVIESASIFTNLVKEGLPLINVVSKPFVNLLSINNPECLIVEPNFEIVLCTLEDCEDVTISCL